MGNCLVRQEKMIKVMKTDGGVLQYKAPIKVKDVLSEFSGHSLSDSLPEIRKLRPEAKLLGGNLYFLVPKVEKKKVRFSDQKAAGDGQETSGKLRIKLVISKQELQELLQKEGVSIQEMISQSKNEVQYSKVWKPELESIPEVD
ncbi:uncharacterized protein LOC123194662 [Mangifera indica]|uniref:uncharacterized protein LOC123194662 n=1 Tax=Mangifera indica TaxID=29780 RepID=UPI001CFBED7A|nr:uncharacterized protein LOC123194662 [Mangifera indica]